MEKELARKVCTTFAKEIVDSLGGVTLGGVRLAEEYFKKYGSVDFDESYKRQIAIRHWVEAAGYGISGEFEVLYSNHIQNC